MDVITHTKIGKHSCSGYDKEIKFQIQYINQLCPRTISLEGEWRSDEN